MGVRLPADGGLKTRAEENCSSGCTSDPRSTLGSSAAITGQEYAIGDAYPDQHCSREPWFARRDATASLDTEVRLTRCWRKSDFIRRRRRLRNTRFPAARYYLTGAGFSPAGTRQLRLTHRN